MLITSNITHVKIECLFYTFFFFLFTKVIQIKIQEIKTTEKKNYFKLNVKKKNIFLLYINTKQTSSRIHYHLLLPQINCYGFQKLCHSSRFVFYRCLKLIVTTFEHCVVRPDLLFSIVASN